GIQVSSIDSTVWWSIGARGGDERVIL
ncbi:hypothetical protein NPIL_250311, partial [Nephila pilipes]